MIIKKTLFLMSFCLLIQCLAYGTEQMSKEEAGYYASIKDCSKFSFKVDNATTKNILGLKNGYCHLEMIVEQSKFGPKYSKWPTVVVDCKVPKNLLSDMAKAGEYYNKPLPVDLEKKLKQVDASYCTTKTK